MSENAVRLVLRADAVFNFLAGLVALFFVRPVIDLIGWPAPASSQGLIYASVLGAALVGLSLAVWFAADHPAQSGSTILSSIIAKGLAGLSILYWVFVVGVDRPAPILLPGAVLVQVAFVLGEAAYLLSARDALRT